MLKESNCRRVLREIQEGYLRWMKKDGKKSREKVTVRGVGCSLHEKLREISIRGYYFPQTTPVLGKRRCSRYNSPYPYTALNACVTSQPVKTVYSPALLTALFSFAVSPPCPSSFLLFAGSETRQNERMWDRQA